MLSEECQKSNTLFSYAVFALHYAQMIVLLYYKYTAVPHAQEEVQKHLELCKSLQLKGRILISNEGINGTCSGTRESVEQYKAYMNAHPVFCDIAFKESESEQHPFAKLFVRLRPELVTLRHPVSIESKAPYITPSELHDTLNNNEDVVLIDMRNEYEAKIGHFRNAHIVPMDNFRELPGLLPSMQHLKDKQVITYCTGGIRCEKASALLRENGFTNVRQLEGGIVKYCEQFPDGHFLGSCFVFDDRMSVRYYGKQAPRYTATCEHCGRTCDRYIDCNDIPCHALCICCEACEKKHNGLCVQCAAKTACSV